MSFVILASFAVIVIGPVTPEIRSAVGLPGLTLV
jgi:hypothetical protein